MIAGLDLIIIRKAICKPAVLTLLVSLSMFFIDPSVKASPPDTEPDSLSIIDPAKMKSESTGMLIATFLGFLFHGAGNYYANSYLIGAMLTIAELIGLYYYLAGTGEAFTYGMGGDSKYSDAGEDDYEMGHIFFFGSWVVDVITTPLAVNKYNADLEKKQKQLKLSIGLPESKKGVVVGFSYTF